MRDGRRNRKRKSKKEGWTERDIYRGNTEKEIDGRMEGRIEGGIDGGFV